MLRRANCPEHQYKLHLKPNAQLLCYLCHLVTSITLLLLLLCDLCYFVTSVTLFLQLLCHFCYLVSSVTLLLLLPCFFSYFVTSVTLLLLLPYYLSYLVNSLQACSYCHATYTYISWQRSERQNDRSQLILVLTKANANDKVYIRPFCTIFKHCCKLTSALRYHALFWRVQVINKRCRFHYVQWSYWSTWMMNASLIRGILFVVTRSLLSRSLKI